MARDGGNEIEVKLRVSDLDIVRKRLGELGAECSSSGLEDNYLFDDDEGSLRYEDKLIRLRQYAGGSIVTFKGARESRQSGVKIRPEVDTAVESLDAMRRILEGLGLECVWRYEKMREIWRYGASEVVLDDIPFIGSFVEIEGADECTVSTAMAELGFDKSDVVRETYFELFAKYLSSANEQMKDMVF